MRKLKKTELIGLQPIQDLIELVLWTAYVKYERIDSLLIIAAPESGKTELVKKYRENNGTITTRRFSAYGIQRDIIEGKIGLLFEKPKILGHILVLDFANTWTFKTDRINSNIAFLDALTEEGLSAESTYMIDTKESRKLVGIKGGLIAVLNPEGFFAENVRKQMRGYLLKGGFYSRNIVISYDIPESVVEKVFRSIIDGRYRINKGGIALVDLGLPRKRVDVYISGEHSEQLGGLALDIKAQYEKDLKEPLKGFRLLKSLISLAKASALRDGRKYVIQRDIDRLFFLSNWMNLRFEKVKSRYLRDDYD